MKNVLARGGIEFLAVLLGISGSLWIDDYSEKKELDKQVFASLHALKDELKANETLFEKSLSSIEVMLPSFKKMLNPSMLTNLSFDELDKIKHHTGTPWSITIRSRVFNSMEASGLLYKIEDRELMDKVLKLYQESYQGYKFIGDYDNTHIHKMDDILLSRFTYRNEDNPLKWRWLIDWNDKNNFELIKNYRVFKSYLITNRGTKRLLKINTASQIRETQNTLEAINQYLLKNKQL